MDINYFENKINGLTQELNNRKNLLIKKTAETYNEFFMEEQRIIKDIQEYQTEIQKIKDEIKEDIGKKSK